MSNKRNLIKNILSLGVVQIANYLLPLISVPIIVRIIGPANYGIINYYSSFVAYFVLLINYGFEYSGTRFIAVEKDNIQKRNEHFTKILIAKFLLFIVSLVLFAGSIIFIAKSNSEIQVAVYTYLISISWVLSPNWFYQGMQKLTNVAIFNFVSKLLYTILILLIVTQKAYFVWQPLILSLIQILVAVISLIYAIKKFKISFIKVTMRSVLDLLVSDRMIFFTMIATNLYTDTNVVILGLYESKEHVGYFTAAWKFILIFLMIISLPLSQALFPFIAESFSKSKERGIEITRRILPVIIYFTSIVSFTLFLLSRILITGFYGHQFDKSIVIFRILTLVPILSYINTILCLQTMVSLKMDKLLFRIVLGSGIFSVIFNLFVIRTYGYIGSALSWVITEVIICFVSYYCLKRHDVELFDAQLFSPKSVLNEVKTLMLNLKRKNA
ncbi:polysaccharide transporter, PST family [Mucilaginibacter sp. OK268]|uniref:flippase n=1 Tax=Mucilaginibacter sp. OK268 TaxID=1881048 RepID=UPI0008818058|nr:flippase [Mucilaginibacter sp. OK268]SDP56898.1 polysaccharide transporter, PST family [Mucilaginibacter sp. OK268]